jgi:hypothetical protein
MATTAMVTAMERTVLATEAARTRAALFGNSNRAASSRLAGRVALALTIALTASCKTAAPAPPPSADELRGVRTTLDELYVAFCFEPGGEADWDGMRALFCDGAAFVSPIAPGATPVAVDSEQFLADFQDWVRGSRIGRTGFHERITHARIELFGTVAHAWVTFDGFVPLSGHEAAGGAEAALRMNTRGLDSLQLVLDGDRWLVASFTSHYASPGEPMPARFEQPRDAFVAPPRRTPVTSPSGTP